MQVIQVSLKFKNRSRKAGLSPGSMVHVGEKYSGDIRIGLMSYSSDFFHASEHNRIEDCYNYLDSDRLTWINIDGLHDTGIIEKIGIKLQIHSLILEDILNTYQRPKIEFFKDHAVIILKMISYNEDKGEIESEQISIIAGHGYIISFQERQGDVFDPLRERLKKGKGMLRSLGSEYLVYSLLDSIIDNYFIVLEKIGESIEGLEEDLMTYPDSATLNRIYKLKREALFLRKFVWPVREIIRKSDKMESLIFTEDTKRYFSDLYDHTIQVIDTVETYRDMISGMLDLYLSSVSHRMNEIMKVLTIIATIFIPLTFIAGVYGMNFEFMPELKWPFGYFGVLGLMMVTALIMVIFFKSKKWL